MNKKKKLISVFIVIILLAIVGTLGWKAIKFDNLRKGTIEDIEEQIVDFRNGDLFFFDFQINPKFMENTGFQNFLVSQVNTMYRNKEYKLLDNFLCEIEQNDLHCAFLLDAVTAGYVQAQTIEDAYDIWHSLCFREYYNSEISLKKDSLLISSYLSKNGRKEITCTPGEGYYANEKDDSYSHTVGVDGSPLYDAGKTTYLGDFKIVLKYGVELNGNYEESPYAYSICYFRGTEVPFSPEDGEVIWSGDYLFCFDSYGNLFSYAKI